MLKHSVALYVPTTCNVSKQASKQAVIERLQAIQRLFANQFGGFTTYQAQGGWVDTNGNLVTEDVFIVKSACTAQKLKESTAWLHNLAARMAKAWKQEAVTLEVDGKLEFVSA